MKKVKIGNYINLKLLVLIIIMLCVGFFYNFFVSRTPVYIQKIVDFDLFQNTTLFGSYEQTVCLNKFWSTFESVDSCYKLSDGQKQIVLLARALSSNKPILLLDEPFSNISKDIQLEILNELLCGCEKKTVIVVDHYLNEEAIEKFDYVINL